MKKWSIEEKIKYIRGFTDGEGGPIISRGKSIKNNKLYIHLNRNVKLSNSDKELLLAIRDMLNDLDIKSQIYLDHKKGTGRCTKDCWALLVLGRLNIERFGKVIGFSSKEKCDKYSEIMNSYKRYYNKL